MSDAAKHTDEAGLITALFTDRESAERGYHCISELGYTASDIDVLMSEETRRRDFPPGAPETELAADAKGPTAAQGKVAKELGGPTGGTIGISAPVVAALGTLLLVPGIGLAVAGPIGIALTAATAVGVAGGIAGALAHWGLPRPRLDEYEKGLREGGILLGVRPRTSQDAEHIVRCWGRCCGASVHA